MSRLRAGFAPVRLVLWLGLALAGGAAWAHTEPKNRERLPDFDRREERAAKTAAARGVAAKSGAPDETVLRHRVRGLAVDRDPLTGSAAFVGSPDTFLTGENGQGGAVPSARLAAIPAAEPQREVKAFLDEHRAVFGHGAEALAQTRVARDYVTGHNGLRTTVWQQQVDAIDVFGATLQAHVTKRGELVNVASRLLRDAPSAVPAAQRAAKGGARAAGISAEAAVAAVARSLGEPLDLAGVVALDDAHGAERRQRFEAEGVHDASARLVWLPLDGETLRLCWEVVATIRDRGELFRVLVAADTGEPLVRHGLTNYLSDASYRVFTSDSPSPWSPGPATPSAAQPALVARTLVTTPALDTTASPNGWIQDGVVETVGNNVDAHTDTNGDNLADTPRPQATGAGRVFDPPLDLAQAPATYRDAAVVDLFYWCNVIHDRLYGLGFTEAAGNFQTNNFGRGGLGNDAVQADAQDGSGTSNANFSTPPDGAPGRMQMYVFDYPTPDRDGDFDHEIVIHEYVHGLSNRLVGGGVGISALQTRGMGEGWSDFYGLAFLSEPADDPNGVYAAGGYATKDLGGLTQNYYFGIRRYPYSTDLAKNPLTFRDLDPMQASAHTGVPRSPIIGSTADEVHNIGEVWCVTLWDARANLIAKHGYATGNPLILQLVTDGMKLSPANPNFLQARDAILQADLVLTGGANRNELWAAFAKRGLGFGATSPASTTTIDLVESYAIPDDLGVSPTTPATSSGTIGGPFAPAAVAYTLLNSGAAPLSWTAADNAAWLGLSAGGGTLAPGASTVVTATPNAAAGALLPGTFPATVTFANTTSGVAQARTFSLEVLPFTEPIFGEDFESGALNPAYWTVTGTSTYRTQVTTANAPHGGTRHLTMDSSVAGTNYVRNEATLTLNLAGRTNLQLTFWAKCFDDDPNEPPASPFTGGADFDGVAISADGVIWHEVQPLRVPSIGNAWSKFTVDLDAAIAARGLSYGANFKIRFNQYDNFDIPVDGIAIDDVLVARTYINQLTLGVPAVLGENAAPFAATVSALPAPASDLSVTLAATPAGLLGLPATVTIPAGQTSAGFTLAPVDDALLNGTRSANLSATAVGWGAAAATVAVQDNETAVLGLTLPPSAAEVAGSVTGTVTVSPAPGAAVTVALTSSLPAEALPPATVVIPAGQTSANFTLTILDDNRIDGTTNPTITASVANWTSGGATIAIADNESTALALSVPASVREGETGRIGTVSLGGTMTSGVVVALSSDDTTELTVPATVTVPAGQTSVSFPVTVVDDALADGAQTVHIGATATGFTATNATVVVADNDAHHFRISPVASPQVRNQPFAVSVTAEDVGNAPIVNFNSPVVLSGGAGITISPTALTTWTNGVWSGNVTVATYAPAVVLTATDGGGHTGAGNAFEVTAGPLHHFAWTPVPSPQAVDVPFGVTVTAQDAVNNPVNFTGTADLAIVPPATPPVIGTGTYYNSSPLFSYYPVARTDVLYLASELGGPRRLTGLRLQIGDGAATALNNFTVRLKPTVQTSFAAVNWDNAGWTTVYQASFTPTKTGWVTIPFSTPYDHDGTSNLIVDFSFRNATNGTTTNCYSTSATDMRSFYGYASASVDPLAWSGTTGPSYSTLQSLVPNAQWLAMPASFPLRPPVTANFSAGIWTGAVSSPVAGPVLSLSAAAAGVDGSSNPLAVTAAPVPTVDETLFAETFEAGALGAAWTITGTGMHRTQVATFSSPHGGTRHLTMDGSSTAYASRNEATLTLNLLGRTGARLVFWAKGFDDDPHGPPASPFVGGANFDGVAISADGTNWYEVQPLRTPVLSNTWAKYTVDLDAAVAARGLAFGTAFKIRFNHFGYDFIPYEGIALDDVLVTVTPPGLPASMILPATVSEGASGVTGSIVLPVAPLAAATFALVSNLPAKLQVPPTVEVPAGQTTASFPLTLPADALIDGDRVAAVTAASAPYRPVLSTTTVLDDDLATVVLGLPAAATEGDGQRTGTLNLGVAAAGPLIFNLVSSDPAIATVFATVTVVPGHTTANFPITILDDNRIDGPQTTTITASRSGFPAASGVLTVLDNETTQPALSLPAQGGEGTAAGGTVALNGVLAVPLVVNLGSDLAARVTVPASVTIPAGQTSAAFTVTYVDNHVADGAQAATVNATAAGFSAATAATMVLDDDPHHFTFATIPSSLIRGAPFAVAVTARDAAGMVVPRFGAPVALGAGAASVTPDTMSGWMAGVWTGPVTVTTFGTGIVLTADDGFGHTGASNAFDVGTGSPDHFTWDPIASPQTADVPFGATIRAVDAGGNPTAGFTGTANLSVFVPAALAPTGPGAYVSNFPFDPAYYPALRVQAVYPAEKLGGSGRLGALALNVISTPGTVLNNWTIRLKHTTQTGFSTASWDNTGWTVVHVSPASITATGWVTFEFQTPFEYDGTSGLMVDCSYRNSAPAGGTGYLSCTSESTPARTVSGRSLSAGNDPLLWPNDSTNSRSTSNYVLDVKFSLARPVAMRPAFTTAFSGGVWTGDVSVAAPGEADRLRADSATGMRGESNPFTVADAAPSSPVLFSETWESGAIPPGWTISGTGTYMRTQVTTDNQPRTGAYHLTMDSRAYGTPARNEATVSLDLAGRKNVVLSFAAKTWGGSTTVPPSPFTGVADFCGVAVSADGTNWYEVQPLRAANFPASVTWTPFTVDLDAALAARGLAYSSAFKIRFNQHGDYYIPYGGLAIDDVVVTGYFANALSVSLPAAVAEGAGSVTGTVQLPGLAATDTVVFLDSSAPAKLAVPATVTVPAGQPGVSFIATVPDDVVLDGERLVVVRASGAGLNPGVASVRVGDNETGTLVFSLPATAAENAGTLTGLLSLTPTPSAPVSVALSSSDPTAATVPSALSFAPGQASASFAVAVVNDTKIDGPQTTTLSAGVPGWPAATAVLTVTDNETTVLSLSGSYVDEGWINNGTISLSGTLGAPLVVSLVSANPARLAVPATVTIPAGATSASFSMSGIDNALTDGTESVVVTASAAGFTSAARTVSVYDNDVHHFAFSGSLSAVQLVNKPFSVWAYAYTVDNRTVPFGGTVSVTASAGGVALPVTPAAVTFGGSYWSGNLAVGAPGTAVSIKLDDGAGHTGTSATFNVVIGPLDHFAISPIASPQAAGVPCAVTITAQDAMNNTVPTYTGSATLSGGAVARQTGAGTTAMSYPLRTSWHDCRTQAIYLPAEVGAAGRISAVGFQVATVPGQTMNNWTIRMKHTALTAYGAAPAWESAGWTTVHQSNASVAATGWVYFTLSTLFDYDGASPLMVDLSFNNTSYTSAGFTNATQSADYRTIYFYTDSSYGDPLTWSGTGSPAPNRTNYQPNLAFRVVGSLPLVPSVTGDFAGGVWTGTLTFGAPATGVSLVATGGIVSGESNVFDVVWPGRLAVSPAEPFFAGGPAGGPFTPAAGSWTLGNTGGDALTWSAAAPPWLTLTSAGGTIAAGGNLTVSATFNPATASLPTGLHSANLAFTNVSTGSGNATRRLDLIVTPPGGDTDGDGLSDLAELAMGLNPERFDETGRPIAALLPNPADGQSYLTFTYRRLLGHGNLRYVVELSGDLATWASPPAEIVEVSATPNADALTETVVVRLLPSIESGAAVRRFVRLRVTAE